MTSGTSDLLQHLDRSRAELRRAVDGIPPIRRDRRLDPSRWSVAEVLEHLSIVEERIAGQMAGGLEAARASGGPTGAAGEIDRDAIAMYADRSQRVKAPEAAEPTGAMSTAAAWAALEQVREKVKALVRESDGYSLAEPIATHRRFGPDTFRQWAAFLVGHEARHADQIREIPTGSILQSIGNTPVVRLRAVVSEDAADVLVKVEFYNPTGSYKDRMALAMIEGAERRGVLTAGMRVVEFTGGSTGSSLAMVCAVKGYKLILLSSDAFAEAKLRTMRALGAEVRLVPSDGGRVTPALFERFRAEIAVLAAEPGTFWTDQFHNDDALDGYQGIGDELLAQTSRIDAFCGAVGTGGMLSGVARALRASGRPIRIVALEPASSPALTEGHGGPHRVEGIGTGKIPPHMASKPYDEARAVNEADARVMANRLAREEGLLVGTSSALNIVAAVQLARELGTGKVVTTVAVDTGLKYLAGDLFAQG